MSVTHLRVDFAMFAVLLCQTQNHQCRHWYTVGGMGAGMGGLTCTYCTQKLFSILVPADVSELQLHTRGPCYAHKRLLGDS